MQQPEIEMDFLAFKKVFSTEKICREHLFKLRWPSGFRCPRCGCEKAYSLEGRNLFQCVRCKRQVSITSGTVMHRTRTPLMKWFWAVFLVCSSGGECISASDLSRNIDIGFKCAWEMLNKIRGAMRNPDDKEVFHGFIAIKGTFMNERIHRGYDYLKREHKRIFIEMKESVTRHGSVLAMVMANEDDVVKLGSDVEKRWNNELWKSVEENLMFRLVMKHRSIKKKYFQLYLNEYCYYINRIVSGCSFFYGIMNNCIK